MKGGGGGLKGSEAQAPPRPRPSVYHIIKLLICSHHIDHAVLKMIHCINLVFDPPSNLQIMLVHNSNVAN